MEGNHGIREADGTNPSPNLNPDVPQWRSRIHGANSYSLTVSYFGPAYFGWQKTRSGSTIQGELETALTRILGEKVDCEAASRTDRGVHALGQIVQFYTTKQIDEKALKRALNGVLPKNIRVLEAKNVSPKFHPTLDAKSKTYHYYICHGKVQDPFQRHTSWHYPHTLDFEAMKKAAGQWIGTHDFTPFTTQIPKNPICTLFKIEITPLPEDRLKISLSGDRFLYKMARRISGTLAQIGSHKFQAGEGITAADITAPPHGLFLSSIHYL